MKELITRQFIASRIDALLNKKVTTRDFGEEMFAYLAFDDIYHFEQGYETLIEQVLEEFDQMHDADKGGVGYQPSVPSRERLLLLKNKLEAP